MDRSQALKICVSYRHAVENGDLAAWLDLWTDNEPQLVVAYGKGDHPPSPFGSERYIGKQVIAQLVFGASDRLKSPRFSAERIFLIENEPEVFFWQFHLEINTKGGRVFDNDMLVSITTLDGKIKEFLEFGDPTVRDELHRFLAVSGDVTIVGNIKVGDIVGGSQIITSDSNNVIVGHSHHDGVNESRPLDPNKISSEQALGRIADTVRLNLGQFKLSMEQARRESSQFFQTTMVFSGVGFAIILGGIGLMLATLVTVGIVTTAASIIPQVGALLLFNKDKELRKTVETYHGYIINSQRILTMIDLAETMEETAAKDSVKEQIIFSVIKDAPPKEPKKRSQPARR